MDPLISVGGPATENLLWVAEFINITGAGSKMPAHFLSTHHYPTDETPTKRTQYEDEIIAVAEQAGAVGLPLVMTEISAGLGNQYDPPFAASFIIHEAAAFLGVPNVPASTGRSANPIIAAILTSLLIPQTLSFWTFTDIFEEPGFQSQTWIDTFGIVRTPYAAIVLSVLIVLPIS